MFHLRHSIWIDLQNTQGEATAERASSMDIRRDHPCKEYSGAEVWTSRVDTSDYTLRL